MIRINIKIDPPRIKKVKDEPNILDLLANGSVIIHNNDSIRFEIDTLTYDLIFCEDKSVNGSQINTSVDPTKDKTLIMKFINTPVSGLDYLHNLIHYM